MGCPTTSSLKPFADWPIHWPTVSTCKQYGYDLVLATNYMGHVYSGVQEPVPHGGGTGRGEEEDIGARTRHLLRSHHEEAYPKDLSALGLSSQIDPIGPAPMRANSDTSLLADVRASR